MNDLALGTRIFNHGDMANVPSWSAIVDRKETDYGVTYTLRDEDDGHQWGIFAGQVSDEYKGNGLTRIVTEAAYYRWHAAKLAQLEAAIPAAYRMHH
jgi:hypothetical protein